MSANNPSHAVIFGIAGTTLSDTEEGFLRETRPWGMILFARNIASARQVKSLTTQICTLFDDANYPILIDQEGGRVQRLRPPLARDYPPAASYGRLYASNKEAGLRAARLGAALLAADLHGLGISINCAPCLDLAIANSDVIGDRAFAATATDVAALGAAFAEGLVQGGVLPVIKHLPGHGRATQDSHHDLPIIDAPRATLEATDFAAFRGVPALLGMTGHLLYSALDNEVSTFSRVVIEQVIRGFMGFEGLLMSDDISMNALARHGDFTNRANLALKAGCDIILHCNGKMDEMEAVIKDMPTSLGASAPRAALVHAALAGRQNQVDKTTEKEWQALLSAMVSA